MTLSLAPIANRLFAHIGARAGVVEHTIQYVYIHKVVLFVQFVLCDSPSSMHDAKHTKGDWTVVVATTCTCAADAHFRHRTQQKYNELGLFFFLQTNNVLLIINVFGCCLM